MFYGFESGPKNPKILKKKHALGITCIAVLSGSYLIIFGFSDFSDFSKK